MSHSFSTLFFCKGTATTHIYPLSLHDALPISPNGFSYGHTFSGYPLGCAVGCAVIDTISEEGLVAEAARKGDVRSEEHTSELQSHSDLVCRLLLEKKKNKQK